MKAGRNKSPVVAAVSVYIGADGTRQRLFNPPLSQNTSIVPMLAQDSECSARRDLARLAEQSLENPGTRSAGQVSPSWHSAIVSFECDAA